MVEPKVFSVGQINRYIKNLLESDFILNSLLVKGEISNFKAHSSGHLYFSLKDATGAVACVMFHQDAKIMPFTLENGMTVVVYGHVSSYEKTGQYQLYVEAAEPLGIGSLQLAFEQLKATLAGEGLFDVDFKRDIPELVSSIAIITSPTGAAVRDIIQITKRRDSRVKLAIFPTLVQGERAAADIVRSIKLANEWGQADVIILGRGGGSMEDLWAFNEEIVARAIFASEIPVISAVGHETDFTIADFVSDLRAPTPSAAAELATVPLQEREEMLVRMTNGLERELVQRVEEARRHLAFLLERPVLKRPLERIGNLEVYVEEKERSLLREIARKLSQDTQRTTGLEARLVSASPLTVMKRGYGIVMDEMGETISTIEKVKEKERICVHLRDGHFVAEVREKVVNPIGKEETLL